MLTRPGDASLQADWIARARRVLPAGGFGNFDPGIVIREGHGARVRDADGREFVDLLIGSGPMLLGHGHPEVLEAIHAEVDRGLTFFTSNPAGIALAEEIVAACACAEQVRYVSTGGEADMYAMRLARAFTGRTRILKFEGGYHGMSAEALMSLAPRRLENFPTAVPDTAGVPEAVRDDMLVAAFNDAEMVRGLIAEHGQDIACVIVEPLQRIVPPEPGFLAALREMTRAAGIVLIFDEVVTGFRLAYGGAQEAYGVVPDLCTLGKVAGGGLPLAAIAGRAEIMAHFDRAIVGEAGFALQMGTLSGNPVAAAAGLRTLEILRREGAYDRLRALGQRLMAALDEALAPTGVPYTIVGDPVLFDAVFAEAPVRDYRDVLRQDSAASARFNAAVRAAGVLKSPGKIYPCLALTEADMETVEAAFRAGAEALVA
ncbi:MAG: aminotransferase class III-fold pyridoxal phosphate-dependent enzyme [Pseudomonadota bacterium]